MSKKTNKVLIDQFRELSRRYSDTSIWMHEAIARKAGLSGTDHKYLGFIIEQEQVTAGELAAFTGLTTGAVTGLIDRLEKKKLVKRQFDKTDRRKVILVPNVVNTMKLLEPIFSELQQRTIELLESFTEKELKIIENYFQSATAIMADVTLKLNAK
ncbi:MarR family winged helix-turn-helix transcriptional regulator [Cytophaga hutchinsonii]|jgi:DNA-binding MarR family transcriptional regulator|uniref:Transcriptional regulator, MarR family n=1 Tax=Cytophaga hutchinsonii (strain ATCC 33406 / DSM 1761 / CIP 103989 / NBRC 15051 / NCIMB 9469 / D465) TaxID=269798 RepID=A0A6N4SSN1_CYTH3|nr:MarR family transcriptional regulator [Cytophaga hutchinsonii]ABG59361.1 transcriptional regulator, MarR family [Cytophaga hutchinsonii ATCC 33406]SFX92358.1 transcriptional regulator, MarR family [Cytophaga hutchinsonii ATCC 33406]